MMKLHYDQFNFDIVFITIDNSFLSNIWSDIKQFITDFFSVVVDLYCVVHYFLGE